MRILLTNDDGITAPGICALHDALTTPGPQGPSEPLGEVTVIAPATPQSGMGHGITFNQPLMTERIRVDTPAGGFDGVSVEGRPADCTKLGLTRLWPEAFGTGERPDVVISGMNAGANVGINVIYSGTVAAAIEAAFLGVPAIAVSLHLYSGTPDFARAARLARRVIDKLLATGLPEAHTCLSINLPRVELNDPPEPADEVDDPDIVVCPMNTHPINDSYERRETPNGAAYYWPTSRGLDFAASDLGTDVHEMFERKVTVTPLKFDLTDHDTMATWAMRLNEATVHGSN